MLTLFSRKLRAPPMSVSFASVISTHSRKIPTACHFWGEHTGTDHCGQKLVIEHLWHCTPQCSVPGVSLGVTWESQQNMEDKVVRESMQIRSALDGPLCSATWHNFKNSHQVPWCYLTQCKGDDRSWFGEKKKKSAKASARQKWKGAFAWSWWWSIQQNWLWCFLWETGRFPYKLSSASITLPTVFIKVISIKTSFPSDIVSLQGFDITLWWQISLDMKSE